MDFKRQREHMVATQIATRGIKSGQLMDAMRKVERHRFVAEDDHLQAYGDHPIFISQGQTISQPFVVASMSEALDLRGGEKVLEIGTGSGYQTAILAELATSVYTVERIAELSSTAEKLLQELGYKNIFFKQGDGSVGWMENAPFDCIIVTAASPAIPQSLLDQLRVRGKLVAPVGGRLSQTLQLVIKKNKAEMEYINLGGVMFVPLIGREGWQDEG